MPTTQNFTGATQNLAAGAPVDVVIPAAPKDAEKLPICIGQLLINSLTPIRNIYVIARRKLFDDANRFANPVIWIDERTYPFTLEDVSARLLRKINRYNNASWYYQQLLKFYVFRAIPDLQPNVLILDSDFFIGRKIQFMTSDELGIMSYGYPFKWLLNTKQYPAKVDHSHIDFAQRLVPEFDAVNPYSGMHHHMLFNAAIMAELFSTIEDAHQDEMWHAFIDQIELNKWNAASEYVIYYHFAMKFFRERISLRHLKSCDFIHDEKDGKGVLDLAKGTLKAGSYEAVGCHSFLDLRTRLQTMDYLSAEIRQTMLASDKMTFRLMLEDGMLQIEAAFG